MTIEKLTENALELENEFVKIDLSISTYKDDERSLIMGNINGLHIANHNTKGEESNNIDLALFRINSVKDLKITSKTKTIKGTKHRKIIIQTDNGKNIEFTFFEKGDKY